ncbi:uncharacterized protein PAC_18808 [Phialocephala subalpina]|uniref:Zn(2)-C6 fungal-type domain-containing protein n=1 Tax=Phialocephala subalpina TaxID=576137 RepID=A0A1L7XV75_9HELO|nr:uncharacterized protein PAC_18808 [Phialocephala subalpina]
MDQAEQVPKPVRKRTSNACDACRARKVKCFREGSSCRACLELGLSCTQNAPRRRRGPPNSYVQAQNQLRSPTGPSVTSPSIYSESPSELSLNVLDQLGPSTLIRQIIDDWFQLIHSVAPILHRGHFLRRLSDGDASHDPEFCGLVISICAATVASLKRRSSSHYGAVALDRGVELINGNRLLETGQSFTLEWCQAKYNLGVACGAGRGLDNQSSFRYLSEAVMGVKYLIYYKLPNMSIWEQQLVRRLYWMIFAGLCMEMFGRPYIGLLTPQDNIQTLRPLDLTDTELDPHFPGHSPWHGDTMSYIPGLNHLSNLFLLWHSSQQTHNSTPTGLQEHINLVQRALDDLPAELRWRGGLSRPPRSNFGTDVQIANLYITQLHIRSNLLEQLDRLTKGQSDHATSQNIIEQRQRIVEDSLEILSHMPRETLEANGHSLVPKIRDIGSALLDEVRAGENPGIVSEQARVDLVRLLERLETLDFRPEFGYA